MNNQREDIDSTICKRLNVVIFLSIFSLLALVESANAETQQNQVRTSDWIEDTPEETTIPYNYNTKMPNRNRDSTNFLRREREEPKSLKNDPLAGFTPAPGASAEENFVALLKLANEQDKLGNWRRAKEYYAAAINNSGHYELTRAPLLDASIRLERLYSMTGDSVLANKYCQKLRDIASLANGEATLTDYQPNTIAAQLLIADTLALEGKFQDAEFVLRQMKNGPKGDLAFYIQALVAERLARLQVEQKMGREATEEINRLAHVVEDELEHKADYLGAKSYLCILSAQACCANAEHRLEDAKALTKRCMDIMATLKTPNQYRKFRTLADRGTTYRLEKDLPTAISYFNRALDEANKGTPLSMVYQSPIVLELAQCYSELGKEQRAKELTKQAASANYR